MNKQLKFLTTLALFGIIFFSAQAQQDYLHQVIILNEGHYKYPPVDSQVTPVSIGVYDPVTGIYTVIDEVIGARFASDILIDGSYFYVAADSFLIKYDLNTFERKTEQVIHGIRKIAVWNNHLLISRGEMQVSYDAYFQVYDKNDLSFIYQLDTTTGISHASEGIVIKDDIAYLAVNNAYEWGNFVGYISKIDLNNKRFIGNIDLGSGKNPDNLMIMNDDIYTLNNQDFSTSSISHYNISNQQTTYYPLNTPSGCNTSVLYKGNIYFQAAFSDTNYTPETNVSIFNTSKKAVDGTLFLNKTFYGMATDPVNEHLYASVTNFTDAGKVYIYDLTANLIDSFEVSAAPGNIEFDVRKTSGIINRTGSIDYKVFPNPFTDKLHFRIDGSLSNKINIQIENAVGQIFVNTFTTNQQFYTIPVHFLPEGIYFLKIKTDKGLVMKKVIKR